MDYVFALTDGVNTSPDGMAMVTTARGQVWAADDPFVLVRKDIFSVDPPTVWNTTGAVQVDVAPLSVRPPARKATKK